MPFRKSGRKHPYEMSLEDLTLKEIYDLEAANPPLVGSRTSVFLEPRQRAGKALGGLHSAKKVVKFRVAKAAKDAILGAR